MSPSVKFLLVFLLGLAAGLFYGLAISPVEFINTTPDFLRIDYQADYILMTAEVFASGHDPQAAIRSLLLLSSQPPAFTVSEAITYAGSAGYAPADIAMLQFLLNAMQAYQAGPVP